ncbi:MAG: hypothetical protein WC942_10455 [Clostridia bacterium]|jgi:hypothetical protein
MGGKSRKTGGISKKLVARLQSKYSTNSKSGVNDKKTTVDNKKRTGLFD